MGRRPIAERALRCHRLLYYEQPGWLSFLVEPDQTPMAIVWQYRPPRGRGWSGGTSRKTGRHGIIRPFLETEDLQCRCSEAKYWATTSIEWSLISRCLIRARQCGVRSAPRRWTILKASMR